MRFRVFLPALQTAYREYFRVHNVAAVVFPTTVLPARPMGQDAEVELKGKKVPTFLTYLRTAVLSPLQGFLSESNFDAPKDHDRDLLGIGWRLKKCSVGSHPLFGA
jgi:mandelamide amidase